MGCWNGTCGLTNMPIKHGDKIVLFLLRYNIRDGCNGGAGITYQNDMYSPITIPIYGEYNDYGGIENISKNGEKAYDHFIEFILKNPYRGVIIDNEQLERAELTEKLTDNQPRDIYELINKFIGREVYKNIGYMMVLEDVLNEIKISKENKVNEIKRDADIFIESYKQNHEEYMFFDYDQYPNVTYKNKFAGFWGISNGFSGFKHPFINKLYALELKEKDEMINSLIDLIIVDNILDDTRKFWSIQSGTGSQNNNYDDLALLSNIILKRKAEIEKRYEEEDYY